MKVNNEILQNSKEYFPRNNFSNTYPDIIEQVDKVIIKYKTQLEQLKPKKAINETNINIQYNKSSEMNKNEYTDMIKSNTEPYNNNIPLKKFNNNYNYNYSNTEIKDEINDYIEPNRNKYNFKYKSKDELNYSERKDYKKNTNIFDGLNHDSIIDFFKNKNYGYLLSDAIDNFNLEDLYDLVEELNQIYPNKFDKDYEIHVLSELKRNLQILKEYRYDYYNEAKMLRRK